MNDNQPDTNNPIAFCQNCGKSLDNNTIRKVGTAVYCEPCLAARIAGAPPAPGYTPVNAGPANPGAPPADTVWQWGAGMPKGWTPGNRPNPGLAALLGIIPGVGAMYNEQYAKGIAHLVIFALLVSFAHITGIFVLFVFGWIAYMSIEAHHTAKARLEGTPLPNPFGLNDIGERMGFGAAWPGADPAAAARDAVNAAAEHINAAAAGFQRPPIVTPPPAGSPWSTPTGAAQTNTPPATGSATHSQPYSQPYTQQPYSQPYSSPYTPPVYTPVSTAIPPYMPPVNVPPPLQPSRFPTGAVVLIAFGMIFLLGTMGLFNAVPGQSLIGVILLSIGVWVFLRRMTETGLTLADDGSSNYQLRLLRALKGSIWLVFIGILALLDAFRLVPWSYSWPTIIILAGVMMIIQRTIYASAAAAAYSAGAPSQTVPPFEVGSTNPDTHTTAPTDTHEGGI